MDIRIMASLRPRALTLSTLMVAGALAVSAGPAQAALVSVDFGTSSTFGAPVGTPSPTFSGPETAATAANPRFGAANVWNAIALPEYIGAPVVNPTFSNLRDSTGAATGIGLSLTGTVKGFSGFNNSSSDALRKDYLFFNSSNNNTNTLSFTITGLVAGAAYDIFVYGSTAARSFTMEIVTADSRRVDGSNGTTFFYDAIATPNGTIYGSLIPDPTTNPGGLREVNWAGFQIVDNLPVVAPPATAVPEPASLALLGAGLFGLGIARLRRAA